MFDYIVLGILQGIFEWLPISSEGIVVLAGQIWPKEFNPIDVALFLHLGTVFAALVYFRKDWKEVFTLKNKNLVRFLVITTIISLGVGFLIYKTISHVAIGPELLLIMGFGLLFTAFFQKKRKNIALSFNQLAVVSGILQGLSVIPGLSRSGSTIFGLSLGEINPSKILKISYMMSVPVILASSIYLGFKNSFLIFEALPALIISFLVGLISLHFLIRFSQKVNFFMFAFGFGLLCFLGAIIGFMG